LERVEILRDLRLGLFDVLIGVNLLREGIDLPEVSLLAILDADKEGFLRSDRSLTQIVGRVARNVNGRVIMYGDKITGSMQRTIDETIRRRKRQIAYNFEHNITPTTIYKSKEAIMEQTSVIDGSKGRAATAQKIYIENKNAAAIAAEPTSSYSDNDLEEKIKRLKKQIEKAAKELDFLEAARLKNELLPLQKISEDRKRK
jgi:excinuclease ABC subunit B